MDGVQAVDLIASWRRILIEGKAELITSMLADIEARLKSKGFERDAEAEKNMNWHPYQRNRVLCFVGGPEGGPRLLLCFNLVSERRIRGGTYSFIETSPNAGPVEVAAVVDDVIRNVIVPSANSLGLKVTRPQPRSHERCAAQDDGGPCRLLRRCDWRRNPTFRGFGSRLAEVPHHRVTGRRCLR